MHPRVLIVGTIPYNPDTSSRAFDAYFHNWEKENLRQIFSNPNKPIKGHCGSLFQITDSDMLRARFHKIKNPGVVYDYDDCLDAPESAVNYKTKNNLISWFYKLGASKTPLNHLARKWLWKEKIWKTDSLIKWLDEFEPQCVFLAFSDDFFINEIALFIADRFDIPIMCCIGDDYYFNSRFSISPFYHIYRSKYKKLIDRVFSHKCSAIYISDKIRDKYNLFFGINGETVYLTSDIQRRKFTPINSDNPFISYCGNIRLGRYKSLVDIANVLFSINPSFRLNIYSNETSNKYIKPLKKCPNINFLGSIPYSEVVKIFNKSDVVLVVEGFGKKDVNLTKYSLSTKVADSIASGCQIITYGSIDCGVIEYMANSNCSSVSCSKDDLCSNIKKLLFDTKLQMDFYNHGEMVLRKNHNLVESNLLSEKLFYNLVGIRND